MFTRSASNIDDLMRIVFAQLLSGSKKNDKVVSRKGTCTEVFGALLELTNPRARLGRSSARGRIFSPLGELFWYLSGSDALEQIQYYIEGYDQFSDGGRTLNGAYGPRIFTPQRMLCAGRQGDEWQRMINTLREREGSRNAIIQIYSNSDGAKNSLDIPCTCTLHFVIRRKRLQLHVHMRSNDAYLGMPHDIFAFTMLQEIAARELGIEIGVYYHSVASLHLYDDNEHHRSRTMAQEYLDEGLHDIVPMPAMPQGDPWSSIQILLEAEREIRIGNLEHETPSGLDPYWQDLITLLRVYAAGKHRDDKGREDLLSRISHHEFRLYILDRMAKRRTSSSATKDLFETADDDAQRNA